MVTHSSSNNSKQLHASGYSGGSKETNVTFCMISHNNNNYKSDCKHDHI